LNASRKLALRCREVPRGIWGFEPYKRLSVAEHVEGWVGWEAMKQLMEHARKSLGEREEAFFTTLFLTGGRVSEVLPLRRGNFEIREDEGLIIVRGMPLLKRYKKIREALTPFGKRWVTVRLEKTRKPFPIILKEPLTPILIKWLERFKQPEALLFPSPYKHGESLSRFWAYRQVRRLDEALPEDLKKQLGLSKPELHLWLHWFRSQRASQLVNDYGFETIDLIDYFTWEHYGTALNYARMGWRGLASKMQAAAYM